MNFCPNCGLADKQPHLPCGRCGYCMSRSGLTVFASDARFIDIEDDASAMIEAFVETFIDRMETYTPSVH